MVINGAQWQWMNLKGTSELMAPGMLQKRGQKDFKNQ